MVGLRGRFVGTAVGARSADCGARRPDAGARSPDCTLGGRRLVLGAATGACMPDSVGCDESSEELVIVDVGALET